MRPRLEQIIAALFGLWLAGDCGTTAAARAQQVEAGADSQGIEFFEKSIRPVLEERCARCHGARVQKPKGGLRLTTRETIMAGGDSGAAIAPGDPDASLLIRAIRRADDVSPMPPDRKLAPEEVAAFEAWVKRRADAAGGGA